MVLGTLQIVSGEGVSLVEGTNTEEVQLGAISLLAKHIRSGVRRRILERLSEGRATVSQIAQSTSIRVPHVSAELKRLREEQLVYSDEESGSRGAYLALTGPGWNLIRSDEIARLQKLPESSPPPGALGRLVSVLGDQLLVAFIRRPQSGPIALPGVPLSTADLVGVTKWTWIEPRERKPRWISSESFQSVPAPPKEIDSSNISAWGADIAVWGLQRFRLIDGPSSLQLATGAWFGEMDAESEIDLPKGVPNSGTWRVGTLSVSGPSVRMDRPVVGIGLNQFSRDALLTSAAPYSITFTSQKIRDQSSSIPLGALEIWMKIAHPRIRESERKLRLAALQEYLLETDEQQKIVKRRRVEDATLRRFQVQWGDSTWTEFTPDVGDWVDTSSLSKQAEQALFVWSLNHLQMAISFDVRFQNSLDSLPSSGVPERIRLLLVSEWQANPGTHCVVPHPVLPSMWAKLILIEGAEVPLNLSPTVSMDSLSEEVIWSPPKSAEDVDFARQALGGPQESILIPTLPVEENEVRLMRAAILAYPDGHSEWANRMESAYPVVSWIASVPSERWSRWERIGGQLGSDWIGLMNPRDIPVEALSRAAFSESPSWNRSLMGVTRLRIRESPAIAQVLRSSVEEQNTKQAAWVARILLSEIAWLTPELQSDLSTWGVDQFLEDPPERCAAAISGLDWLATQFPEQMQSDSEDWRKIAIQVGFSKPQDHDLHLWAVLVDWLQTGNRPHTSVMPLFVKHLPEEWWAPFAETILTVLSETPEGIAMISESDIAWPSLILRPQGEVHRIPGDFSIQHSGVRRTLLSRLERLYENEHWLDNLPGSRMIQDLSEALKAARDLSPPKYGLVHPMVRWLALPVHRWPPKEVVLMTEGDSRITARISKMVSGWHADLSRNVLDI